MAIDAKMIKELREKTGMGITDCKKALTESDGNMEEAEMILRKKGIDKAAKKADRATGEGVIASVLTDDAAMILELACEQEPTTGNQRFLDFLEMLKTQAVATKAENAEALLGATVDGETIADHLKGLIGVVGENVTFKRLVRVAKPAGGLLGSYVHHNKKTGAVCAVALEGCAPTDALQQAANDVCMHAVAARPLALNRDGIPAETVAKEKEVALAQIADKPDNIKEKIVEGKMNKFFGDTCLTEQIFVKDPEGKMKVAGVVDAAAKEAGGKGTITAFARLELGAEG